MAMALCRLDDAVKDTKRKRVFAKTMYDNVHRVFRQLLRGSNNNNFFTSGKKRTVAGHRRYSSSATRYWNTLFHCKCGVRACWCIVNMFWCDAYKMCLGYSAAKIRRRRRRRRQTMTPRSLLCLSLGASLLLSSSRQRPSKMYFEMLSKMVCISCRGHSFYDITTPTNDGRTKYIY